MRLHEAAIMRLEEALRVYDANSRVVEMDPGERQREAAAAESLRDSVGVLLWHREVMEKQMPEATPLVGAVDPGDEAA